MKLNKKIIDKLESSIRKLIEKYEPFEYGTDDEDLKFVKIEPYILWNRYQSNYTINLFYIFNKFFSFPAKNMARQHGLELIKRIKMVLPILENADYDIHIKTKKEYKQYEDELIPQVRMLIPENKDRKRKHNEEYYENIDKVINKFLSSYKSKISDTNFSKYIAVSGEDNYGDVIIKITGLFEEPFSKESSNFIHSESRSLKDLITTIFPQFKNIRISAGSTSTIDNYEKTLSWEKKYINRKVEESNLPFKEVIEDGIKVRTFDKNIDDHELQWHRDERDRIVEVVKGSGWKFQMDDELPITLKEGDRISIPSEVYHRVIRGSGDLIIKIKEL